MPQSFLALNVHLVFSTKERRPLLRDPAFREEMHAYLGGLSKKKDCPPLVVGGTEDHVHLVCLLGRTIAASDWVKAIKRSSTLWARKQCPAWRTFRWQAGYAAFAVSQSNLKGVIDYVLRQEEHHRKMTFKDEFIALLRKHECEYDERYVWD